VTVRAERLLESEKEKSAARIEALHEEIDDIVASSAGANADDEHDSEGSTIAFERARIAALLAQEVAYLAEIDAALRRVENGGYGRCERCGTVIATERMAARPVARTCVGCPPMTGRHPR